jgi:hypothetical protein
MPPIIVVLGPTRQCSQPLLWHRPRVARTHAAHKHNDRAVVGHPPPADRARTLPHFLAVWCSPRTPLPDLLSTAGNQRAAVRAGFGAATATFTSLR